MKLEKRTALILRGEIIAIFKSEEDDIVNYVFNNYMDLGLSYEDVSRLKHKTIYVEL